MGKMVRAVLFAVMAVFSTAVFAEDEDPCASLPGSLTFAADGYYEIGTADALYKFACMVNGGATSINGRLTADICLNACGEGESVLKADGTLNGDGSNFTQWTPMNVGEGVKVTLNGNGKTISGLYFDDINEANVGLFGKVEGALSINNLGIVGSYFKGKRYVGGLVGRSFYGTLTIMNSYNVGTVCGDYVVGGLVGKHASYGELTIANSYNAGAVSGRTEIGGLVGYFDYYSKLTITNSYNSGAVTGESGVGGFVGGIAFEEVLTIIENSYNVGTVSGTDDCVGGLVAGCSSNYGSLVIKNSYNLGAVSGHYFIGGLVATSAGCSLTIENSYNAGAVSGGGLNVGGLVGWNNSGAMSRAALIITNSYNAGTVRGFDYVGGLVGKSEQALTITNSYNAGAVSGSDSYVGGLVGESEEALTITNSFFLAADGIGGCNGKCPAYSGTGKSEEEFHNGDVVAELHNWCETEDGTETCKEDGLDGSVWGQDLNDVNSLPDFSGVIGTQHLLRLHTFEGDTRVYPTKYAEEYEFKLPTDLVRDGYVFVGWSTKEHAESVTDMVSSIATGSTGDLEFYAQWMKMNSEHVFEIASEEDLYEFAKWTNMGFVINAKLVENICVNACGEGESVLKADGTLNGDGSDFTQWTPIGTETQKFEGTFDGAGHTISGLYVDGAEYAGLFGYVFVDNINGEDEKGVVKNVSIEDSYISGTKYVGGVVAYNEGRTLSVYNAGNVTGSGSGCTAGGVVGYNVGLVSDAYNVGAVKSSVNDCSTGGVVGLNAGFVFYVYNIGAVSGGANVGGVAGSNSSTISKAYFNTEIFTGNAVGSGDQLDPAAGKTVAQLSSLDVVSDLCAGEDHADQSAWVAGSGRIVMSANKLVYKLPGLKGFSTQPEIVLMQANDQNVFEIGSAQELKWFAEYAGSGAISINAKLTANICLNACGEGESVLKADGTLNDDDANFEQWTPINIASMNTNMSLDGNGHTISGLYFRNADKDSVGFFGSLQGTVSISNLGIEDSYIEGKDNVGVFVGVNDNSSLTIANCFGAGYVKGNDYVAGFVGQSKGGLNIANSYSVSIVNGEDYTGGFIGSGALANVANSFFLNGVSNVGGTQKSADEFHDGTVATELHNWCEKEDGSEDCKEGGLNGSVWGQVAAPREDGSVDTWPVLVLDGSGKLVFSIAAELNGGSTKNAFATKYEYGTNYVLPIPERANYTFGGWFTDATFTEGSGITEIVSTDFGLKNVYAKWIPVKYTIKVSVNDKAMGTVAGAGEYEYGAKVEISAAAKKGYKFVKWSDGVKDAKRTITVTKAEKLTATFEKDSKKDAVVAMAQLPQFSVTASGKMVSIAGVRPNTNVIVYDLQGNMVKMVVATSANFTFALPSAGVYIVKNGYTAKRVNVR